MFNTIYEIVHAYDVGSHNCGLLYWILRSANPANDYGDVKDISSDGFDMSYVILNDK